MEQLTKHQLILLALLVSFITSIATGIVTVALMNQAPLGVVQTINRVVEHTIETVISTSTAPTGGQTVVKTMVVSTDNQTVNAISQNAPSLARIYRTSTDPSDTSGFAFVGLGTAVKGNVIATDGSIIDGGGNYFLLMPDNSMLPLSVLNTPAANPVALLVFATTSASSSTLSPVTLAQADVLLGQTVIYIGGQTKNSVATGIVSSLITKNMKANASSTAATSTSVITGISTSIPSDTLISGGLLVDLSGNLVGIRGPDSFIPAGNIASALASATSSRP